MTVELPVWVRHLVFDHGVSRRYPVIKGTKITVNKIISDLIDGYTDQQILQNYPILTVADIEACRQYIVDEETTLSVVDPNEE